MISSFLLQDIPRHDTGLFEVREAFGRTFLVGFRAYIYIYSMTFFGTSAFFVLLPAGLSCSRFRGTLEARVNTGCKCMPWPRSVARALRVQSRGIW